MDMMKNILEKIIGNYSKRALAKIYPIVEKIESLETEMMNLSDEALRAKTNEFKNRLLNGETLDDILPEVFAVIREGASRVLGMRHFTVQLIGGIVLHQGRIAEMKTGEGKTLVATLSVYLNALLGKGVHVVTVNDYLAKRDSEWMGKIYTFLGLSVGVIVHDMDNNERRAAYNCDITYATNNELGFDYLRDNMVMYKEDMVQRSLYYAIVDEVDSILIDESRTPLIISGQGDKSTDLYKKSDFFVRELNAKVYSQSDDKEIHDELEEDYIVDEKSHSATLTPNGMKKAEQFFGVENLSDPEHMTILHHVNQALKAHGLMKKDIDYIEKDGEILIVDEFTGRLMYGRRYSAGLHQAIEAKEGVRVERESKTLATITFQNYFRLYQKLAGMTGTALTEENEFRQIYKLDVVAIPTNKEMIRLDMPDCVYRNQKGKFNAIVEEIVESNQKGQPVLVGTISIEKSEMISNMLKKRGIRHEVLNAKYHQREAEIVAQAGKLGAVTIATNMAGRGTDIVLGGNPEFAARQEMKKMNFLPEVISQSVGLSITDDPEILNARLRYKQLYEHSKVLTEKEHEQVVALGGLKIIGTERHESRRIDNQLRGRSGRQGDPGATKFYLSLEDDLMKKFGSEKFTKIIDIIGLPEDEPIEHRMLSRTIESAQKRVEGVNFSIRKNVVSFDDVINKQREIIYTERRKVLNGENLKDNINKMIDSVCDKVIDMFCHNNQNSNEWNWDGLISYIENNLLHETSIKSLEEASCNNPDRTEIKDIIFNKMMEVYEQKDQEFGEELMREAERFIMLKIVDERWMEHIDAMDELRHGIFLRAYGQRDPIVEYKIEGFQMFDEMITSIQEAVVMSIMNIHIVQQEPLVREKAIIHEISENLELKEDLNKVVAFHKEPRNKPCPCGSGKKYKKCCGSKQA